MSTAMDSCEEMVEVVNACGEKLVGILCRKVPASQDVAVLCHGFLSDKNAHVIRGLATELPFNTFRFDFCGYGDSDGQASYGGYYKQRDDLQCVIAHLTNTLKLTVQLLIGHSKGANVVLLHGVAYPGIPLVNLSGRFDMSRAPPRFTAEEMEQLRTTGSFIWKKERPRPILVTAEGFAERNSLDMTCVRSITVPVLTVHGTADATIPVEDAHRWGEVIAQHSLVVIDGASHQYPKSIPEVAAAIVACLASQKSPLVAASPSPKL
mmetsp:Transcript_21674/g.37217  ORF Transcript_21674/g.37217 Transcript_21674/m.37217 type:complete len:265 (+) Transcript_21674:62-856(+)